jgi:hypothetical protein
MNGKIQISMTILLTYFWASGYTLLGNGQRLWVEPSRKLPQLLREYTLLWALYVIVGVRKTNVSEAYRNA